MCKKLIHLATLSFALSVILVGLAQAADPDLVAHWKFDDGSGTTATDSSVNGNDGTFVGEPEWVAGKLGGALDFDGNNEYVDCGNDEIFSITDAFSVTVWINWREPTVDWQTVIAKGDNTWRIARGGSTQTMDFGFDDGTRGWAAARTASDCPLNEWHHVAATIDKIEGAKIYLDGVLEGTNPDTEGISTGGTNYPVFIGENSQAAGRFWIGLIDDVRVYKRVLTESEILGVMAGRGAEYPAASDPNPPDGALYSDTWVTLSWRAGDFAVSHDVYLGENFDDVNEGTGDTFRGNQSSEFYVAGFPGFAYPEGLVPGTTYYWRVDEVNEADPNSPWKGPVWSFTVPPKKAYHPSPVDGDKFIALDATLSWTAGFNAKLHTVYFGEDFETISHAVGGSPQAATTYNPGVLESGKTYYWRVDEFDGAVTHEGDVWRFSTLPEITMTDPDLAGWWKFDEGKGEVALDWSGHGNHGTLRGAPQWVVGQHGGALYFDGSSALVRAPHIPLDSRSFTITMWVNPELFTTEQIVFSQRQTSDTDTDMHFRLYGPGSGNVRMGFYNNDLDSSTALEENNWYHLAFWYDVENQTRRIYIDGALDAEAASTPYLGTSGDTVVGSWDGASQWYRGIIDDVRIYSRALTPEEIVETTRGEPDLAWGPNPADGSTPDLTGALPLSWSPGDFAAQHDVYFGIDKNALEAAEASDATGIYRGRQTATSYTPPEGVEWGGGPYYWRIDEVNTDGTISMGRIWTFTVADFLLVDDFEGYTDNDADGEAIWQYWIDGYGVADNGSQVGYLLPPYAEKTIIHSGSQSMPLLYNNTNGVTNSQAELTLAARRDWTEQGVEELSLWFRGLPGSTGSFVEGPVGVFTMTGSGADIWNNADEFHYAYKSLTGAGSMIARIESVSDTNTWAKAGVMIRETLDPGSKHAFACVTPGQGVSFQRRPQTDSGSNETTTGGITAPYWVKIERGIAGNFSGYVSTDGITWTMQGMPESIQMGSTVYIGLAVTSHDAGATCEAVFSNVTTTGNVSGQWAHQDIGIVSNAAEPLYVAVSNASGSPAVMAHDDPAAAQIDAWTEWRIPLQAFADQGINLNNVDKIAIGLGSESGMAAAGGSGTVYFDDIRLYRPAP